MLYLTVFIKYETTLVIRTQRTVSWRHGKCLGISPSLWKCFSKAPPEHVIRNELKSLSSLLLVDNVGEKYPGRPICTSFFVLVQSVTYGTHQADSKHTHISIQDIQYKECLQDRMGSIQHYCTYATEEQSTKLRIPCPNVLQIIMDSSMVTKTMNT